MDLFFWCLVGGLLERTSQQEYSMEFGGKLIPTNRWDGVGRGGDGRAALLPRRARRQLLPPRLWLSRAAAMKTLDLVASSALSWQRPHPQAPPHPLILGAVTSTHAVASSSSTPSLGRGGEHSRVRGGLAASTCTGVGAAVASTVAGVRGMAASTLAGSSMPIASQASVRFGRIFCA